MSDENETVEPTCDVQYTSVRQLRVFVGFDNGSSRWPLRHELIPACRALLEKMTPEERSCVRVDESAEVGKLRKRIDELSDTVAIREKHIEMLLEACGGAETVHEAIDKVRRLKKQATCGIAMANEWRDDLMSIRDELSLEPEDDVLDGVREFKRHAEELLDRRWNEVLSTRAEALRALDERKREADDLRSSLNGALAREAEHEKAMAQIERERDAAVARVDVVLFHWRPVVEAAVESKMGRLSPDSYHVDHYGCLYLTTPQRMTGCTKRELAIWRAVDAVPPEHRPTKGAIR